jgi:hypothetical protein
LCDLSLAEYWRLSGVILEAIFMSHPPKYPDYVILDVKMYYRFIIATISFQSKTVLEVSEKAMQMAQSNLDIGGAIELFYGLVI